MIEKLLELEQKVKQEPPLKNQLVDIHEYIFELGGYEPHYGLRPKSKHWRKASLDGSCFHITCDSKNIKRIHWDKYDPRQNPILHFWEIVYNYFRYPIMYIRQP